MSTPVVLLFSGQGAQRVGMGADLVSNDPAAKAMLGEAAAALGWPLDKIMLAGKGAVLQFAFEVKAVGLAADPDQRVKKGHFARVRRS